MLVSISFTKERASTDICRLLTQLRLDLLQVSEMQNEVSNRFGRPNMFHGLKQLMQQYISIMGYFLELSFLLDDLF